MSLALVGLRKIYDFACSQLKALKKVSDPDMHRTNLALEAVEMLHKEGDGVVKVVHVFQQYEGKYATDIPIKLLFQEKAQSGHYEDRYITCTVDITSWKALGQGLKGLGRKFEEANHRADPDSQKSSLFLAVDYTDFIADIDYRAQSEPKL